jgi:carbamoyltransferase|tara:strand:- start:3338 stop:5104 length:1767 start_codon:yes stop_codon:yes gene_type:complete
MEKNKLNILGLKIVKHDTGAALISNGEVVAIGEERLNRVKHSPSIFPELSIDYCLNALNIKPKEVNLIVIDQVDHSSRFPMKDIFLEKTGDKFKNAEIHVINHHDAHAASAFFVSPFDESAILIYDGAGEKFKTHHGIYVTEADTLYYGKENTFYQIQKTAHLREGKVFPYTFSIGKLYDFLSSFYLGFGPYNEGKMMGLAPYGDDSVLKQIPEENWYKEVEGHVICNSRIEIPHKSKTRETLRQIKKVFKKQLFGQDKNASFESDIFSPIKLPKPKREKKDILPDKYYSSVAYAAQKILEKVACRLGTKLKNITRSENLCVSGGVGLNIDANKNFLDKVGFKNIFIQPGSSDSGIPLGCALYGYHMIKKQLRFFNMKSASLGREYSEDEIIQSLKKEINRIIFNKSDNVSKDTAKLIADNNIIGWFQGGSEYGPRALGNRSILCDARNKDMKNILNEKVKHREGWRPFATSILRENLSEYFEFEEESPFMLIAAEVKGDKKDKIPSVIHVDDTSRIQTVTSKNNKMYHKLISSFYDLTGVPLILNTSFNLGGDPIVETPKDALDTFLKTKMDFLIIGDYIIKKKSDV